MSEGTDIPTAADYPEWVGRLVAVPPAVFAVMALTDAGDARPVVGAALTVALIPWLVQAVGRPLPDAVFAASVIAPLAALNLAGGAVGVDLSGESHNQFSLMILVWLVGEMSARSTTRVVGASAAATVSVAAGRAIVEPAFGHSWTFWVGGAGVAFITGYMLRRQQQTLGELRRAQVALAGDAARRERQRIAREVHDVVAHTLTVTLMHVSTARRALDRDPASAREALDDAETLGRRSLADIRRTVGLLRAEDEGPDTHALPDASDLPALLDSYRTAGVPVRAEISGDVAGLAPAASLTLYRIVQEALSNAVAHAEGAAVDVRIVVGSEEVEVTVSNPVGTASAPRGGGLGLVGMRERVSLLGGEFEAGAATGTWTVTARLPRETAGTTVEVRS